MLPQLTVKFALFGWIPVSLMLFTMLRPRHAIIVAYMGAWLFLPMDEIKFKGIPDLSKVTASSFGVAFGVLLFDWKRLLTIRPKWYDLPMLVWCLSPWVTSIKNDLGTWDAMSSVVQQFVIWGIPYFIGRIYFNDWDGFRELAIGIFVGGVIYVPFCWLEMWISPQLHRMVYGHFQSPFNMTQRWGGYRPMVFMQSGLALSFWMVVCSLTGLWLWTSGSLKKVLNVPMAVLVPGMFLTTVMCKSAGALLFMVAALGTLYWIKWFRNALPLVLLVAFPAVYMYQRINQNWTGEWLAQTAEYYMGPDRARSLQTRLNAENLLTEKALEAPSPAFGWGKWSPDSPHAPPWRVGMLKYNGTWKDLAPSDGLWIIALGQYGLVGLISLTVTILLPTLIFWSRVPLRFWHHPLAACASPMAVLLAIHMSDHLLNAMINPIFMMALGGISAIGPSIRKVYKAQQKAAAQGAGAYAAASGGHAAAPAYTPGATYPVGYTGYPAGYAAPAPIARPAGAAGGAWRP